MKRLFWLLFVLTGTLPAQAQQTRFYVRGGVNAAHFTGPDAVRQTFLVAPSGFLKSKPFFYANTSTGTRLLFGPTAGIGIRREGKSQWGFGAELSYQGQGSVVSLTSVGPTIPIKRKVVVKISSLIMPLFVHYRIGTLGRVLAGTYGSYGLRSTEHISAPDISRINYQQERSLKQADVGGVLGFEVPVSHQFRIDLRYQRSFTNAYPNYVGRQPVAYHENFQLALSYFLN